MNRFAMTVLVLVFLFMAMTSITYTFQKCGWKAFMFGNGAGMAAITGMCD